MDRQMFTSNPPVKPEIDERNRADVLHASALAMAKTITALRGKFTRRRASSDGDLMHKKEDRLRSEQIRKQMTLLNSTLTRVDEEKRARDREALLAAAQRNVKARLREMDEKVQADTGRVPHGVQEDWGGRQWWRRRRGLMPRLGRVGKG
ncbi:Eisosome assembly protein [Collariella sp. IMI 366227]|nr:Eisosome assembly protein [Collariella sp. IMI 366227]